MDEGFYAKRGHGMKQMNQVHRNLIVALPNLCKHYPVVYIISEYQEKQFGDDRSMCLKDSWGAELALDPTHANAIVIKREHSAFSSREYAAYIHENHISEVILTGVLTEWCVRATALDAIAKGLQVTLVLDGIATGDDEEENRVKTLDELMRKGAVIKQLSDLL